MSIIDTAWRSGGLAEWETSKREGHDGLGGSELMSSSLPKGQTARAYTPPKGRPTPARRDRAVARSGQESPPA